jgi:type I restriction enzyme S subunit
MTTSGVHIVSAPQPRRRMPEFADNGDWVEHKIGDFLTESREKGSKGDVAKKLTVKLWGKGVFEKEEALTGSANTQYYRRSAGQFIYSKLDFLNQAFGIVPEALDGFESTIDLPCFDIKPGLNPTYLLEYVQRESFYKKNGEIADGGRKARRIQPEVFFEMPIILPRRVEEQEVIAEAVLSLDALIEAETEKLDALKDHKKGLMLEVFPVKGETLPKRRFPEFQDPGGWVEKPLGEIANYENGKAYEKDIEEDGDFVVVNARFISTDGEVRKYSNERYCIASKGDVLMVLSDLPKGRALAKCFLVDEDEKYAVNQRVSRLTAHSIDNTFLYYALDRHPFLLAFNDGLNQTHLSKGSVLECPIAFPLDENEQAKIVATLKSVDEQVTSQAQTVERLKDHKQGLLQQLFPVLDEVDG